MIEGSAYKAEEISQEGKQKGMENMKKKIPTSPAQPTYKKIETPGKENGEKVQEEIIKEIMQDNFSDQRKQMFCLKRPTEGIKSNIHKAQNHETEDKVKILSRQKKTRLNTTESGNKMYPGFSTTSIEDRRK